MLRQLWLWVVLLWFSGQGLVWAESLGDRLRHYPDWTDLPSVSSVKAGEDLIYPAWMAGTWQVTSTLTEQIAPLAPEIVTPGFEQNRALLARPFQFLVKFQPQTRFLIPPLTLPSRVDPATVIVADRAFNGAAIAKAYLGAEMLLSVKTDPANPNRQLTKLKGDRLLISTVTGRASEQPQINEFISSEMMQQQFQNATQIYLNQVETTTDYAQMSGDRLTAEQVTAIYLSPTDPDYFLAQNQPVALYRYHLELQRVE